MANVAVRPHMKLSSRARARVIAVTLLLLSGCRSETSTTPPPQSAPPPAILLVTLDTTRFDAIGDATPAFQSVAKRGRVFRYAYATAPQTLPSHSSMLTGLYPAGHGVHENARALSPQVPLVAEKLKAAGYRTAAFVSSFSIARRFGLARGFDVYDDEFAAGAVERNAKETTDRALAWRNSARAPFFLWVHLFDPHAPYAPPAPFRGYRGEVEFMDSQLARLLEGFDGAVIIAADHGEGLGDHGEAEHGYLAYNATMHVPMAIAGPGVNAQTVNTPVSTRRVFHTILDFAGMRSEQSLRAETHEVVMGEAMVPFLQFGWQPQVIAVDGTTKAILAGRLEVYDVATDPVESKDLGAGSAISREMRTALREYPLPSTAPLKQESLDDESRRKLASLGYVASTVKPVVRAGAPRPVEMARLFPILDSTLR